MLALRYRVFAIVIGLCWTASGWAHGVEGAISTAEGYLLTARYDDGEPMSYAQVKIQAPDSDLAFQTGRTDRNGRLMFQPDRPGPWQVEVKDGMGHRTELSVEVSADRSRLDPAMPSEGRNTITRLQAAVTGLATIFGLSGLFYGWRARRRPSWKQRDG